MTKNEKCLSFAAIPSLNYNKSFSKLKILLWKTEKQGKYAETENRIEAWENGEGKEFS